MEEREEMPKLQAKLMILSICVTEKPIKLTSVKKLG